MSSFQKPTREQIQVLSTTDGSITGVVARKYCFVVGHRAVQVRQLIAHHKRHPSDNDSNGSSVPDWSVVPRPVLSNRYGWSDVFDQGIRGDSLVTKSIWEHTREILNNKKCESEWKISSAGNPGVVFEKSYELKAITTTVSSAIFGALLKDLSASRVFKYTIVQHG